MPWFPHCQRRRTTWWFQLIEDCWRKYFYKASLLHQFSCKRYRLRKIWRKEVIKYVWSINQLKHGSWCILTMSWSCLERESKIVWGWKSIKLQHHQQQRHHVSDFTVSPLYPYWTFMKFQTNNAVMTRNNKLNITITAHWSASSDFAKRVKVHKTIGLSFRICQPCCKTLHVNWRKLSILCWDVHFW